MSQLPNCLRSPAHSRRRFFHFAAAAPLLVATDAAAADTSPNVLGPVPGYSPQIGVLVSEMTWMRGAVLRAARGMTVSQLDFLLDDKANRIGALLMHLAATERLYQLNTFESVGVAALERHPAFADWKTAMDLSAPARDTIKGHNLDHYLSLLSETREKTLSEFRKRDDKWLLTADASFVWGPTNNLCKWFHVCEHESHHTGQISLLAGRAAKG